MTLQAQQPARRRPATPPDLLPLVFVIVWVLAMISIPILRWTAGNHTVRWGVPITVLLLTIASITLLVREWGAQKAVVTFTKVLLLAWLVEYLGRTIGFPFGYYDYTKLLQPQLLGVPLLIPLAWMMMLPPAWAMAYRIAHSTTRWSFVATSALAFTAWDLFLDPQMVAWGFWGWETPGPYFGIPLVNFAGWIVAAALITLLVRPAPLGNPLLPAIYAITWILQTVGLALFWEMPGPALAGFLGMGLFVFLAWLRTRATHKD